MKKMISGKCLLGTVIGLVIVSLVFLAGCSSQDENKTADKQQTFKLIFQSSGVQGTAETGSSAEIFKEEITKRSNGRITFESYYGGQPVKQSDFIDALNQGIIDIASVPPNYYSAQIPTVGAFNLPFLTDSQEKYLDIFRGEVGEIIKNDFEANGVKLLTTLPYGEFNFYSTTRKLLEIEDFNNLKVAANPAFTPWYDKLGIVSVPLNPTEIYEGLQRGIIDGVNGGATMYKLSLHEVLKYMYEPSNSVSVLSQMISLKTWNKLPPDLQQIILDASKYVEEDRFKWLDKEKAELMKYLDEYNIEIARLSPEVIKHLEESSQVIYDSFAAKNKDTAKIVELLNK